MQNQQLQPFYCILFSLKCVQVAGNLQVSANNSLNNYLNDQSIQENWNVAQENVSFTCNT